MEILKGYRTCGKTTFCIKEAYLKNAIIVTGNKTMACCIRAQAREMYMPVEVVTVYDIIERRMSGRIKNQILIIDQLEHVLYALFQDNEIYFATTDLEVLEFPNCNKKREHKLIRILKKWLKKFQKLLKAINQ